MATCLHPISVRGTLYPCGKCPVCRQNYRQSKGERFLLACAFNKAAGGQNFFWTLTYNEENLNWAQMPNCFEGDFFPCFRKQDIKVLFDKIRRIRGVECKYFCSAEYGEQFHRPHYHLIVLFPDYLNLSQCEELVQQCWTKGHSKVSYCSDNRVLYAAKYCLKDSYFANSLPSKYWVESYKDEYLDKLISEEPFTIERQKRADFRTPFTLISNNFLSVSAVNYLNDYIFNGGNIREFFVFNEKRINFDTYIKNHIDPSLKAEMDSLRENRISEYQKRLCTSREIHSKYDCFGKQHNDYSFDTDILKHREKLKSLKKHRL